MLYNSPQYQRVDPGPRAQGTRKLMSYNVGSDIVPSQMSGRPWNRYLPMSVPTFSRVELCLLLAMAHHPCR
eukprot:12274857-Karenia_brevis.AAC.1